jgi:hypothetical protein
MKRHSYILTSEVPTRDRNKNHSCQYRLHTHVRNEYTCIVTIRTMNVHYNSVSVPLRDESSEQIRASSICVNSMDSFEPKSRLKTKMMLQRIPPFGRRHSCGTNYRYSDITRKDLFVCSNSPTTTFYTPPQPLSKIVNGIPLSGAITHDDEFKSDTTNQRSDVLQIVWDGHQPTTQHKDITVVREVVFEDIMQGSKTKATTLFTFSDSQKTSTMSTGCAIPPRPKSRPCFRRCSVPFPIKEETIRYSECVITTDNGMEQPKSTRIVSDQSDPIMSNLRLDPFPKYSRIPTPSLLRREELYDSIHCISSNSTADGKHPADCGPHSDHWRVLPVVNNNGPAPTAVVADSESQKVDENLNESEHTTESNGSSFASIKSNDDEKRLLFLESEEESKECIETRQEKDHVSLLKALIREHLSKKCTDACNGLAKNQNANPSVVSLEEESDNRPIEKTLVVDDSDGENTATKSDENAEPSDEKEEDEDEDEEEEEEDQIPIRHHSTTWRRENKLIIVPSIEKKSLGNTTLHSRPKEFKFERSRTLSRWSHIETISTPPQQMDRSTHYATKPRRNDDNHMKSSLGMMLPPPSCRNKRPCLFQSPPPIRERAICPFQDIAFDIIDDEFFPSYFRRRTKRKKRYTTMSEKTITKALDNTFSRSLQHNNSNNNHYDSMCLLPRNLFSISEESVVTCSRPENGQGQEEGEDDAIDVVAMKLGHLRRWRRKRLRNRRYISYEHTKSYHSNTGFVEAKRLAYSIQIVQSFLRVAKMYEDNQHYRDAYFQYVDALHFCRKHGR